VPIFIGFSNSLGYEVRGHFYFNVPAGGSAGEIDGCTRVHHPRATGAMVQGCCLSASGPRNGLFLFFLLHVCWKRKSKIINW